MVQFAPMNHHGITMMILVAVGDRFTVGYVSLKKTTIHGEYYQASEIAHKYNKFYSSK